ncbi:MAG: hypothetical protein NW200_09605 [Hyphomonadaceae bacterium]|nr:hypothetical protein [Hyphomonadaceae bacterium]
MDQLQSYLSAALDFLQQGYNQVNGPQGLIIALLAVVVMQSWGQLLAITLASTVAYAVVEAVRPIVLEGGALKLPPVTEPSYWVFVAALYVGLLVIIAMFFAVKRVFFMGGGARAKAKAH